MVDSAVAKRGYGGFTRHYWAASIPRKSYNTLVWVNRWSNPLDLRHTTPSQASKFVSTPPLASKVPLYWVPVPEAPLKSFSRAAEEKRVYDSFPATRGEEWSSMRQMLPSKGYHKGSKPPRWGTSQEITSINYISRPLRYSKVNSLMTK